MPRRERSTPRRAPDRDPSGLPRPVLWPEPPPGQQPLVSHGRATDEDAGRAAYRSRLPWAWAGVALMIAGAVLVAVGIVVTSWWPLLAGVAVGLVGAVVALRSGIMNDVSDSD